MLIIISAAAVGIAAVCVAANIAGPHYGEYDDIKCGGYGIGYGIYRDYIHGYGSGYSGYWGHGGYRGGWNDIGPI